MHFLVELGLFAFKTLLVVGGIITILVLLFGLINRERVAPDLEVEHLNRKYQSLANQIKGSILPRKKFKQLRKEQKSELKEQKESSKPKRHVYVLDFHGDIRASGVASLREEVTGLLNVVEPEDEVVVRLDSPGGMVNTYGLAASQLKRIKHSNVPLTVCVDKVAASGGYMMACLADRLIAAPFAIIGSIGVVAQIPNLNRLLKKNNIDYEEFTAGEYKRTVGLLGEITPKGRKKFNEQLEQTHGLFKRLVADHRPELAIDEVSTGEFWFGQQALDLKLVDELQTSDDYLLQLSKTAEVYRLKFHPHRSWRERIAGTVSLSVSNTLQSLWERLERTRQI